MAHRLAGKGGVDLEALSPRDANAQRVPKATTDVKTKTAAQLKAAKEKEHPPPPPAHVIEPPSSDRPDGAVYQVGKLLGKGGFAVCYHGQLQNTKHKYALKIVKSQMPAKMEQKVRRVMPSVDTVLTPLPVPNRASDPLQDAAEEYRAVPASFCFREFDLSRPRALSQRVLDGYGEAPQGADGTRGPILLSPDCWCHQVHARQGYYPP